MKKVLNYFIFVFFLLIPFYVKASYAYMKATNQNPVVGDRISITLGVNFGKDAKISEAHYVIKYDPDVFEIKNSYWSQSDGTYSMPSPGTIYIDKEDDGNYWQYGDVFVFVVEVLKESKTLIDLETNGQAYFKNGDSAYQTVSDVTLSPKQPNTVTGLGTLYVEGYSLSPLFNTKKYYYTVTVPSYVESVNVVAKAKNDKQTITGAGTRNLVYGDNLVVVTVTAQNGDSSTYKIMITRPDDRTSNKSLQSLTITNTEIRYEEGKYTYETEVSKSVDKIFISASPVDPNTTIVGLGEKNLSMGMNTFEIIATSSDGTSQTYTFKINRSSIEFQSFNTGISLASLKVNGKEFDTKRSDKYLYVLKDDIETIPIEAVPQSSTAKLKITGNEKITSGANCITITVTETTGESGVYRLYVYKYSKTLKEILSLENSLDANQQDIFYLNKQEDLNKVVSQAHIRSIRANGFILYYGVLDENEGLQYQIKLDKNTPEQDINANIYRVTENILPTYHMELPPETEVTLYVGDLYDENQLVKVYSYETLGNYTIISPGVLVKGGYVTFKTKYHKDYIVTPDNLIEEDKSFKAFIEQNKKLIAYFLGGVLVLVIWFKLIQYMKIKKQRKI